MSIYRYDVDYLDKHGNKYKQQFSRIKEAAEHVVKSLTEEEYKSITIYEAKYENEEKAKQRRSMSTVSLWSLSFSDENDLLILAGQSEKKGSCFIRDGKAVYMTDYVKTLEKRERNEEKKSKKDYELD